MSGRKRKRRDQKRKTTRRQKASISSRHLLAAGLHRRPCLWDVLIHELAVVLSNSYRQICNELSTETFRLSSEDLTTVGWMLAKGFEIFVGRNWPAGSCEGLKGELWQLDEASAERIAECTASQCFDPILRKYVEDTRDIYPGRPHADLTKLTVALREALGAFLISRCSSGGNLYKCLTNPLADDNCYFPDNGESPDPPSGCGDPLRDIYRLGLMIHDEDDGSDMKRTLAHFVRTDPWLFAEWKSFVREQLDESKSKKRISSQSMAIDEATDEFIFRATHLDGKTPIQLFLERQKDMCDRQRQRMLRWDAETFYGIFLVRNAELPFVNATDLASDKSYRLKATKPEALRPLKSDDLLFSRVTPWDDHWLLSGIQQRFEGVGKDQDLLSKLKRDARFRPSYRYIDNDDPRIQEGFKLQEAQYQAWIALFGQEELLFEDGLRLGAAMNRFHRYWTHEMVLPDSGLTRAQSYRQTHGHAPPELKFPLPDYLLKAKDTAAVFDRRHGLAFYVGYGLFRSAFEDQGPLTPEQVRRVWDYLTDRSTDFWLFQRMRDRYSERTQYVFRQVLKDKQFRLDRDFDPILGKFKGESVRRPVRPMIIVIDPEPGNQATRKVLK